MICLLVEAPIRPEIVAQFVEDSKNVYGDYFRAQPGFVFGTMGVRREEGRAIGVWYFDTREHLLRARDLFARLRAALSASLGVSVTTLQFDVLVSRVGPAAVALFGPDPVVIADEDLAPPSLRTDAASAGLDTAAVDRFEEFSRDLKGFQRFAWELPALVWMMSPEGRVEWSNARAGKFGALATEATVADQLATVHPDDRADVAQSVGRAIGDGEPLESQFRSRRSDGAYRWVTARAKPVRDVEERIVWWVGVITDIDEYQRGFNVLETMFSTVPVALAFVDRDFRLVYINEAGARLRGIPVKQLIGRRLWELMPELWSELEPVYRRVLDRGESIVDREFDVESPARPGEPRHWMLSFYPVRVHREVIGVGTVAIDVSERKRAELDAKRLAEQRRRVLGELIRAQETERQRIAADIHGDTLQVLAAARLRLEQLDDSLREAEQHAAVDEFDTALAAAQRRLRNLLFELWPPSLEQTGLRTAISELLARFELESNLTTRLESDLAHEPPVELRSIVFRVVAEALSNVRRHAFATSVEVELSERDGELVARISDDGVGFEPTTASAPGHIGLLEMRERAQTVGGRISITSIRGHGASVELRFPLEPLAPIR
jgi:PAS domain S-box-containing protein